MQRDWAKAGVAFRWSGDQDPKRILVHDNDVIMYDAWQSELGEWSLGELPALRRRSVNYYVTSTETVYAKAAYLRDMPLSDTEAQVHRPDLPFCLAACEVMQWTDSHPSAGEFERSRAECCGEVQDETGMTEVYLSPFGPKGGDKRGVRVAAEGGATLTVGELLWKAMAIQFPLLASRNPVRGVGLYRLGLQGGIPSYYLWGSRSRLDDHVG
ncbi:MULTISPECIES: hypothetical protein [Micromonospora]|uniref:Uncharacterized protein n=1 Tax=Micromonospora gifhornensis TaxID=84594 RepID=A0ABQ4IFF3_9ACTN|nr:MULTISPECIES: hypothetical protein [Micromonospora]GIJ16645.1 hypothetical protein Vgi01_33290 [Micromonospora gifhornensis]